MMRLTIFMCVLFFVVSGYAGTKRGQSLRVALIQAHLQWGDVDGNLKAFGERVERCGEADVIVFPELFASGCEMKKGGGDKKAEIAARYGDIREKLKKWAVSKKAVVMGSTIFAEGDRYYNRLIVAFPDGKCLYYDKHNCFKKGAFSPGEGQLIFDYKGFKIATYICYDLRFVEWSRNTTGYDVAVYVANWPASRREDWQKLLRERAKENKAHVIGVNCAGTDPDGLYYAGDSGIVGMDGEWIDRCDEGKDEIKVVRIYKN
ncbi:MULTISPECIES: nitrilase-related carbon-nitrogen hydrolase [Butyricimonas]|uniref:nitrilase-related carbon-nitrogen hydrolase n=1 Tax=Butyricimonas TaxID=574697 RepID=UPI001D07C087|nr:MULTISPECIES: nitrilase-related carbon-nitrogen hydrolase [Butyricimonas]MCB6971077.1 nitrilase [Butyricimonas synergistica]MCG4517791.1 nitrilase [Butyricimonas sp. DFI.6.44]